MEAVRGHFGETTIKTYRTSSFNSYINDWSLPTLWVLKIPSPAGNERVLMPPQDLVPLHLSLDIYLSTWMGFSKTLGSYCHGRALQNRGVMSPHAKNSLTVHTHQLKASYASNHKCTAAQKPRHHSTQNSAVRTPPSPLEANHVYHISDILPTRSGRRTRCADR